MGAVACCNTTNARLHEFFSSSDKMRGTIRPGKAIDRLLLMGQEHPACALIELMQLIKTASRPNGVFHHAPEAFHGIEMITGAGGQQLQAEAPLVMGEGRLKGLGAVDARRVSTK
jgi:hypothetical protein